VEYIDELIARDFRMESVLGLLCLASIVGAVKVKQLDAWRKDMIQVCRILVIFEGSGLGFIGFIST
jgi:hypothetical protein